MDGGQGSARKLWSDAVGEMEGQTQTESKADERRQGRLMEVCDAGRKKKNNFKHKRGGTTIGRYLTPT